jgi:hypothetical protein
MKKSKTKELSKDTKSSPDKQTSRAAEERTSPSSPFAELSSLYVHKRPRSFSDDDSEASYSSSESNSPLTASDTCEDWIDLLVELIVDHYQKRYNQMLFKATYLEEKPSIEQAMKKERIADDCHRTYMKYITTYIEFDKLFIKKSFAQSAIINEGMAILNNYHSPNDTEGFKAYLQAYFQENFRYGLISKGEAAEEPITAYRRTPSTTPRTPTTPTVPAMSTMFTMLATPPYKETKDEDKDKILPTSATGQSSFIDQTSTAPLSYTGLTRRGSPILLFSAQRELTLDPSKACPAIQGVKEAFPDLTLRPPIRP